MKMKKFISLVLTIAMLLSFVPANIYAAEGETFTIDFGTYDKSTSFDNGGRYYLKSTTKGENWSVDVANTTSKVYYAGTTSACRLQSQITISKRDRTDGGTGPATLAFKFTAPKSGVYNVTTDVLSRTVCGYVDVHLIDGSTKIYLGRMDNYNTSDKEVTKKLLSATLEGGKEYSIAYTPVDKSSGTGATLYVYRTKFTPTDSPVYFDKIKVSATKESLTKGETCTLTTVADISNGALFSFETAGGTLSYESTNTAVATVSADGVVTAIAEGNTTIKATVTIDGTPYTDSVDIVVTEPKIKTVTAKAPKFVLLSDSDGEKIDVSAKLDTGADIDMNSASIEYQSLNEDVALVSASGVVTPVSVGTASVKITVTFEGRSVDTTVQIPVTEEPLPDGIPFSVDFRKVDRDSQVYPSNTTSDKSFSNASTHGDIWTIDTVNSAAAHYDGTSKSVRIQSNYAYISNRGPFAVNFTVEEGGKYNVDALVWSYSSCDPADFYIDGTYVGTIDMLGTTLTEKEANLVGVELTAGTHSLIIVPSIGNAFVSAINFTPVKELDAISGIDASVESEMMYSGAEQSITVSALVPENAEYDIEKGKKKFDGSVGSFGDITFEGYDSKVISVSDDGIITALSVGTTTITAKTKISGIEKTDTVTIEVRKPVLETVEIAAPRYILMDDADGETLSVSAKLSNGKDVDMSLATVVYESLTPKFATVSENGVVMPIREGSAEIKATVTFDGTSVSSSVVIPMTKESLPDGSAFNIDFGTVDKASAYTEDDVRFYMKSGTYGENWALDTANTTSKLFYDNKTKGIRVAQPGITATNRTGDRTGTQGWAIKFTAPESGTYDINAIISIGPVCGYTDVYLIDGTVKTYIGSFNSWDSSTAYPQSDADLVGVTLEGGKEYSIAFRQRTSNGASDTLYIRQLSFTPVKVPSEVVAIDAMVEDNNLAAGETVDLVASAVTSNGAFYEIEKSKSNPDGGLSVTYRSENEEIATVSDTGVIRAVSPGKVKIFAEMELSGGTVSKSVLITVNTNTYESADVNIDEESVYVVGGSQTLLASAVLSDGGRVEGRDVSARFESLDESIAKIEDGVMTVFASGETKVTAYVTFNGMEKAVTKTVRVEDVKLASILAKTSADRVSALDDSGTQINVTGILNNGENIRLADAMFTYESLTPEIVSVDESGRVYYVSRGVGTVKVFAEVGGNTFECECEVTSSSQKTEPTVYTYEMREQAKKNVETNDWARSLLNGVKGNADRFVENLEKIYDMIPVEGVPRASGTATWNAGADYEYVCPYCKEDLQERFGGKPWLFNPLANPWKVQCPACRRLFPSNDFESFYKLGITENGVFDRELALQKNAEIVANGGEGYLVNKLYPNIATELGIASDKVSTWMVDDGFGWSDVDGTYGTQTLPKFTMVAHYAHLFWDSNGPDDSFFTRGIRDLRDAYLYTGDIKYGRAGAILLDRVADVYPDFDLTKVSLNYPNSHGMGYNGKIVGAIWETRLLDVLNSSYDAFYPATDDPQVIRFLSDKAEELGLSNPKTSADMIRENMEDGLLRETFSAVKKGQANGNFGMHQLSLTYAAVGLDNYPETDEMFNWLGKYSTITRTNITDPIYGGTWSLKSANSGGDVLLKYVRDVCRDGFGNEVGVGYNALWLTNGLEIAEVINRYDKKNDLNLFENPKYVKMFSAFVRETLGDGYTIHLGDSGRVGGPGLSNYGSQALRAYNATKNPLLAQVYYFYQGGELSDVYVDIFTDNDGLKNEVQKVIDTYGEYKLISENLTGFGLGVLRGGNLIKGATSSASSEQRYDTWMYHGRTGGHGHYDGMSMGIDAYGFNMMPDLGYPENTGYNPNRLQWISATISHNTVTVDGDSQGTTSGGKPLHFDDSDKVKLIDADAPAVYGQTDIYRRTAVTVAVSNEVAYTLDFFRVKGGNNHIYSFHSQSYMGYSTDDLELVPQKDENGNWVGSYAGADVPYGEDPNTDLNSGNYVTKYTRGYTWLENVNRAINIEDGTFSVNFEQTDFNKQVTDSEGLNLKFTALNDWAPTDIGIVTGYAPRTSSNTKVPGLDYMLIHREGEDLDTLFTSLLQPYKGKAYIKNALSVPAEVANGREGKEDVVKAVKIEFENGRCDYVVYATNNAVTYTITDGDVSFDFRGFVGVYSLNENGENIYSYINDGDIIGDMTATAAYTGKIVDYTKELTDENSITVSFDTDVDLENLPGRYIYVNNSGSQNGSYRILGASEGEGGNVILDLGDVSLINGFISTSDLDAGYVYNISAKQTFSIPLSTVMDDAPVFSKTPENLSASAGSSVSVAVKAESPLGEDVTYKLLTAPRGASIDEKTGVITWKPTSSQIGESGFAVSAVDEDGRENTMVFEITVYGSTSGGGGGASAPTKPSDKTENDVENGETDVPQTPDSENVRFTDLGAHAWAADAINALADKGIIKGTSATTYSPAKNITRADFAILLVRAFEKTSDNTENFADVSDSDYFAKELAIARNTGLVGGIGDNKFAPRDNIKRCDMMLMVYRVIKDKLVGADIIRPQYEDFDSVPEYAKEAVSALISAGLVNGKGDKIAPNDNTTRAEVAVLLSRVLEYADK